MKTLYTNAGKFQIEPRAEYVMTYKQGSLDGSLSVKDIANVLGFSPNGGDCSPAGDGDGKVEYEWQFTVNGEPCAIWDYHYCRWSVYNPEMVARLFPNHKVN